ncbi:hypothetical protein KY289_006006 [Solanum tuberosum]|nr:hypothetical protein KY289_006006 [Solanum tuberosum]
MTGTRMDGDRVGTTSTGSGTRIASFPVIDHNHPLFLQNTEIPSSSLISLQLTGLENYDLWSRSFRIGLVGRSKIGFVDGRFPKSMFEPELHDQWKKCNAVVLSWIVNAVRPGHLSSVVYPFDAQKDEYDVIMPCPSCPYPESKKFGEHCDYQRLLLFLMGLNESYSPPRSQILMMSHIPSLNKAYALLIDQESQRSLASTSSNSSGMIEGTTMYTHRHNIYNNGAGSSKTSSTRSFSSGGDHSEGYNNSTSSLDGSYKSRKNFLQCEHCGCKGHSREQCYKIVGYHADFKSKRKPLNTGCMLIR